MSGERNRDRYRGKNLFYLLVALCLPAGLLYLRLVLGLAASDSRVGPAQSLWLNRSSGVALVLFGLVQIVGARYVQRTLPAGESAIVSALKYIGVLIFCVLFSLTGAIVLEAFGLNVFLRAAGRG